MDALNFLNNRIEFKKEYDKFLNDCKDKDIMLWYTDDEICNFLTCTRGSFNTIVDIIIGNNTVDNILKFYEKFNLYMDPIIPHIAQIITYYVIQSFKDFNMYDEKNLTPIILEYII